MKESESVELAGLGLCRCSFWLGKFDITLFFVNPIEKKDF
jgi:hypothetical protein